MSPLGTLEISSKKSLLNFNNLSPMYCVGGSNNAAVATPSSVPITTNDHLIKLMSLSLVNEVRGPAAALNLSPPRNFLNLHNHQNIIQPLTILNLPNPIRSPSFTEMLLKSGHLPGGSPIQIPSPNSSGSGHPESPRSTADTGMTPPPPPIISCITTNDDDEVLSIGRDDDHQQLLQDCDNSSVISDEDMKSTTTAKDFNNLSQGDDNNSQGSMEYDDLHDDRSSQNSSESHSHNPNLRRNRQYSSEDSFTIKSLCSPTPNYHHNNNSNDTTTSTASPPPTNTINSNNNGSSNNNNNNTNGSISNNRHSSLLFSIANILRPDFGLCNNTTTSPFAPGKSLKSPPITDFNYKRSHNHHQTNHKGSGRNDSLVVNPIDLSRPSSTGSQKHHHHQNQHKISSSGRSGGGGGNSNGNSSSGNKRLKLNNESANSLTKGNSNSEKNNSASNNNNNSSTKSSSKTTSDGQTLWPAWVYCTRYSDRPSSGPRARRMRKNKEEKAEVDEKRPRTAFTAEQLARLKKEFDENRYLTEKRRQDLAKELRLHENQIKIWFQNKRAKLKKATGTRGGLALQLMAQGLYNHSTIKGGPDDDDDSD